MNSASIRIWKAIIPTADHNAIPAGPQTPKPPPITENRSFQHIIIMLSHTKNSIIVWTIEKKEKQKAERKNQRKSKDKEK